MDEIKSKPVWFNKEQQEAFEQLKHDGLISRTFAEFCKDAFYDKIDSLNITKITRKQLESLNQC